MKFSGTLECRQCEEAGERNWETFESHRRREKGKTVWASRGGEVLVCLRDDKNKEEQAPLLLIEPIRQYLTSWLEHTHTKGCYDSYYGTFSKGFMTRGKLAGSYAAGREFISQIGVVYRGLLSMKDEEDSRLACKQKVFLLNSARGSIKIEARDVRKQFRIFQKTLRAYYKSKNCLAATIVVQYIYRKNLDLHFDSWQFFQTSLP